MQVEKIFEVLQCTEEQKVRLGTFMLEGDVEHWWGSVKQSWERSGTKVNWDTFLEAFNEKYFPDSVKERKEVEFIELQQGKLTVEQYAAKFLELSRYAPHVINMEAQKVNKFERGLMLDIRGRIMAANLKTFSPLVDLARKIERDCDEYRLRKEQHKTRPTPSRDFQERGDQRHDNAQRTFQGDIRQKQPVPCGSCGKLGHAAPECWLRTKPCFKCGKLGHLIRIAS
ncbi:uncharacterized protein LOC110007368 [Amborella trichopoda]|uniref:uncharacterized protein LOC110007368 n=1 Tax=Amborella trichopoda TaxID=13333 RepID=UPI0009BD169A|nr:uncharacterized protein LOC110007368 [Amborella trichopoda]|eukprot:XP_020523622.1 uncharacterized protein LOC110007368 [Amborella trichopoda]